MKKIILVLATALALGSYGELSAQNQAYTYVDETDSPMRGVIRRVSPNGIWAAGGDEDDETGSIIINTANPTDVILDPNGMILDITDSGMAVGAWYEVENTAKYKRAAIYKDGKWTRLPLPEEIIGQSYAVAISADLKTIAGHGMCLNENPDEPGKYFPMIWRLNETTNEYELERLYNNLYLPGTFGFFIQDMTPDGKYICGYQCLDFGDVIAAMMEVETGKYTIWHNIEYKEFSFDYLGTTLYDEGMFIDGILDGFDEFSRFNGGFSYATDKYLFGGRGYVTKANEDGSGEITNCATIYDLENGTFIDGSINSMYSCGISPDEAFNNKGEIINGSKSEKVTKFVDAGKQIDIIYGLDAEAKILGGAQINYAPWGEAYVSPVLVILDKSAFAGIEDITVDGDKATITIDDSTIRVNDANDILIYNANGTLISTAAECQVTPGIYVIVADGTPFKVIIQ